MTDAAHVLNAEKIRALQEFHTTRRQMKVAVVAEKSRMPLLWLDTSVLADMGKIAKGQAVEPTRAKKLKRLRSVARKAIRSERLICPEWDQAIEYEFLGFTDEVRKVVTDLSCGAHCIPPLGIKDAQVSIGLKAYFEKIGHFNIPASCHFREDPLEAIRRAKENRFIVDVTGKPEELLNGIKKSKVDLHKDWESIRQEAKARGETFDERLNKERMGDARPMMQLVLKTIETATKGTGDIWDYMGGIGFFPWFNYWEELSGEPDNLSAAMAAVYSFMQSPYYWELPIQDVRCRLSSDLVVRDEPVKSGDAQDVENLSLAIPVAQYVVADNAMVARCVRTGVAKKWNAKLFASRNLDELCDEIERL